MPKRNTPESFYARLRPDGDCLIWTGPCLRPGTPRAYGRLSWSGKDMFAHRVAWVINHGSIAPGLLVCHKCDRPLCCNVDHLYLGTHKQNMADMVTRKRAAVGERQHNAKLNAMQVLRIREMYAAGALEETIAKKFGVHRSTIGLITARKRWAHL